MTHKYPLIAAGVAAALAGGYVQATPPTITEASGSTNTLFIAGSSAAKNAIITGVETDICGDPGGASNTLLVSSTGGTKNFFALSCNIPVAIGSIPATTLVTIYYRTEGGSVVGALPVISGHNIKRIDLTNGGCAGSGTTATCPITGSTTANGPNDTWGTAIVPDTVDLGVTDVEPGQLTGNDFPTQYAASAFGAATTAQMKNLNNQAKPLFDQVFGLVVNNTGGGLPAAINLTQQSAANILNGTWTDWHQVPDAATGTVIAAAKSPITVVNREAGSGTRTSANIYFLGYQCSSPNSIPGSTGNFSTTDLMNQVNTTPGAIGYASIDNVQDPHTGTSFPNVVLANINGVTPSNKLAATGQYDYWYEAQLIPATGLTGPQLALSNFLVGDLPKLANAPSEPDINVIPGVASNVARPTLQSNGKAGTSQVFVAPYTRGSKSCNVPGGVG
jgi:ABC-type phosphate transport system substrate-binding protein